jgi:hypothetical protein
VAGPFGSLDREALASIGIDLDVVSARIEAVFGPGALTRLARAGRPEPRFAWRKGPAAAAMRRARVRRRRVIVGPRATGPRTGPRSSGTRLGGHIPFAPRAKKSLEHSLREALAMRTSYIGVEHLTLALAAVDGGMVPTILSALGTSGAVLRTAILDRYRQAS